MKNSSIKKKLLAGVFCNMLFFFFFVCNLQVSYGVTISPPTGVWASQSYPEVVRVMWTPVSGATNYTVYRSFTAAGSKQVIGLTPSTYFLDFKHMRTGRGAWGIYYYWVTASNSFGTSDFSSPGRGMLAGSLYPKLPSPPTGVSASDGTYAYKVRVTWNSVSGALDYTVHRATSAVGSKQTLSSTSGTTYNDTSAVAGTTYYYFVTASNPGGTSGFSPPDTGSRAYIAPPSPPTDVSASDGTYTDKVRVTWNSVSARFYTVYRTASAVGSKQTLGSILGTTYNDTSAVVGTIYYYFVTASNHGGTSGFSPPDTGSRAYIAQAPSSPTDVYASTGTYTDKVRVMWNSVSGATDYTVHRATSALGSKQTLGSTSGTTYYDDTSAVGGTTYYYFVTASNSSGNNGFSSPDTGWRAYIAPTLRIINDLSDQVFGKNDWKKMNYIIRVRIGPSQSAVENDNTDTYERLWPGDHAPLTSNRLGIEPAFQQTTSYNDFDVTANGPDYYVYIQCGWWDESYDRFGFFMGYDKHVTLVACCDGSDCWKWASFRVNDHSNGRHDVLASQFLPMGNYFDSGICR